MANESAFLIDGTAFCYRAFFAIRDLKTSEGRPTNAVYGFAKMLQALRDKEHPSHLAVAFDLGKPTFRHERFDAYKVQRKPMPEALVAQLPVIKRLLAAYRIPVFEQEGYEAEDVLATIAKRLAADGLPVFLVTGDKDALQLVNSHVKVYNPHHDGVVLDAAAVKTRYGVGPDHMVDLMALMGDPVDNIPGVRGIGEKTARALLERFGSLDALYARLDEVKSAAQRKSLEAGREQAALCRELARIRSDVPVTVDPQDLRVAEPDRRTLRRVLRDLEFTQLLRALDETLPAAAGADVSAHLVASGPELEGLLERLRGRAPGALGCWAGETPDPSAILSIAPADAEAWVVSLDRERLGQPEGRRLSQWLADPKAEKLGHDAKTARRILRTLGLDVHGLAGDTMVAAYLLNPARTNPTLRDLTEEYLEEPCQLPEAGRQPVLLPRDGWAGPYAAAACAVRRLHARLHPMLEARGLGSLYTDLELPLIGVLADMEAAGVAIDVSALSALQASMGAKLRQLTDDIYRLAGTTFNLRSPRQLAQVLFERLKLPVVKRTKTGPSTDSEVLHQLAEQHPLPGRLMEFRELSKLVSTYVESLPRLVDPTTRRLHTTFNQTATATGRLSSSEPNLQNIPIKTEWGRAVRKAFVPGEQDAVLLAADYSQIELRILAHLSGDLQLAEAFREGRDIHRATAGLLYGIPEDEVQPEQRQAMKAVNYGILYGMTPHGLSKELGIPLEDAQQFISAYFERYPKVRVYLDGQIARAKADGFVETLLGRRRDIPEVQSPDLVTRQFGERIAVNAPVQGTAADLIKRAMVDIASSLKRRQVRSRMVIQVHDELVFECPREELGAVAGLVQRTMEGAIALSIPIVVTLKAGPNWLELRELSS